MEGNPSFLGLLVGYLRYVRGVCWIVFEMMRWVGLETTKKQGGGNKVTRIRILNTMGLVQVDEFLDIHNFNHL